MIDIYILFELLYFVMIEIHLSALLTLFGFICCLLISLMVILQILENGTEEP